MEKWDTFQEVNSQSVHIIVKQNIVAGSNFQSRELLNKVNMVLVIKEPWRWCDSRECSPHIIKNVDNKRPHVIGLWLAVALFSFDEKRALSVILFASVLLRRRSRMLVQSKHDEEAQQPFVGTLMSNKVLSFQFLLFLPSETESLYFGTMINCSPAVSNHHALWARGCSASSQR